MLCSCYLGKEQIFTPRIFAAIHDKNETLFTLHRSEPDKGCAVGRYIQPVLENVLGRALSAMESELARVSIGDIVRGIEQRVKANL